MTYAVELQALESEFDTEWALTGNTPVQYENDANFIPPTDQTAYVRFWVLAGESFTVGGQDNTKRKYRHTGVIQIDCLAPEGLGAVAALTLADQAAAIFRGKRISGVLCRAPGISRPGEESGYFRVTASINYQRDELL